MKATNAIKSAYFLGALVLCGAVRGGDVPEPAPAAKPRIEAVFVLDTTGSMSGMIHAAQEKIWSIACTLCQSRPAPEIKIGLVGYRDRGDGYITRITPLSPDLDRVYVDLMSFRAEGGGDSPESVNQALFEAVTALDWSVDDSTYRVIFLVGDCPPHMDYQDDVHYQESCRLAAGKGILVNTIQCGIYPETRPIWSEIAFLAGGRFFRVEQEGGAVAASTPYDGELARLSHLLDATRVFYGAGEIRAVQEERMGLAKKIYAEAPSSALAQRTAFNQSEAGLSNFIGRNDLVNDLALGAVSWKEVAAEELPENMRAMSPAERAAFIEEKAGERRDIQERIRELSEKRQRYIKEEVVKKAGADVESSLDHQLYAAINAQAAAKGIACTAGPVY